MANFVISCGFLAVCFSLLIATYEAYTNEGCRTLNGESGECVPIRQCAVLSEMIMRQPLLQETKKYLRSSLCGGNITRHNPTICCPNLVDNGKHVDSNGTAHSSKSRNLTVLNNSNLPSDCGRDQTPKIKGGITLTVPSEFPWTVLLEYTKPSGLTTPCTGALLSERYVLTAAHCVKVSKLPKHWNLKSVRLGEYDTSKLRDCLPDWMGGEICADVPISVPIEERIVHASYGSAEAQYQHDIALLRLSRPVLFTSYIKPICLPTTVEMSQQLWLTGWGNVKDESRSTMKIKLGVPLVEPVHCNRKYRTVGLELSANQLCAGGERNKDLCNDNGGGPLMSNETTSDGQQKWTIVGIVSFGPVPCGTADWPVVYTNVVDYVPWILENIRP